MTATEITELCTLEKIYRLRVIAWRDKILIPADLHRWKDATDDVARHWAVLCDGRPIAAARFSIHIVLSELPDSEVFAGVLPSLPLPICSLNRCVVHPDYRGFGLARRLDEARLSAAIQSGCRSIVATVSDPKRAKALVSYGFKYVGDGKPYSTGILKGDLNIVYVMDVS